MLCGIRYSISVEAFATTWDICNGLEDENDNQSINCMTSQQCPSGVNSAHRFVEDLIGFEARKL